jgi:hypothetical protein
VNDKRYDSVLYSLDHAIELFSRLPTSTSAGAAAYEALQHARAMLTNAFAAEAAHRAENVRLVAKS